MAKRDISHGNYESEILLVARRGSRNRSGSVRAEEYRSSHGWERSVKGMCTYIFVNII